MAIHECRFTTRNSRHNCRIYTRQPIDNATAVQLSVVDRHARNGERPGDFTTLDSSPLTPLLSVPLLFHFTSLHFNGNTTMDNADFQSALEKIRRVARERHKRARKAARRKGRKDFPILPVECTWAYEEQLRRSIRDGFTCQVVIQQAKKSAPSLDHRH